MPAMVAMVAMGPRLGCMQAPEEPEALAETGTGGVGTAGSGTGGSAMGGAIYTAGNLDLTNFDVNNNTVIGGAGIGGSGIAGTVAPAAGAQWRHGCGGLSAAMAERPQRRQRRQHAIRYRRQWQWRQRQGRSHLCPGKPLFAG